MQFRVALNCYSFRQILGRPVLVAAVLLFDLLLKLFFVEFYENKKTGAPALQCLDVLSGAGELPWRLVLSCVCAGLVPLAPAVGAVLAYLRLAHWWHAVCCAVCVVSSVAACMAP